MGYTVSEIAAALEAVAYGDTGLSVERAAEPADAGRDDLALAMDPKYASGLPKGNARVALLWDGADWESLGLSAAITVRRPRFAMAGLTALLDSGPEIALGIHPTAVIDRTAEIGVGAAIGPLVVIGAGVRIGSGAPHRKSLKHSRGCVDRIECAATCGRPRRPLRSDRASVHRATRSGDWLRWLQFCYAREVPRRVNSGKYG